MNTPENSEIVQSLRRHADNNGYDIDDVLFAGNIDETPVISQDSWGRVRNACYKMRMINLYAGVVVHPTGQPLEIWQKLFTETEVAVPEPTPDQPAKALQLEVAPLIADEWMNLVPGNPGWSASLVSEVGDKGFRHIPAVGQADGPAAEWTVRRISKKLGAPDQTDLHPSLEAYLGWQLGRVSAGEPLADIRDASWLQPTMKGSYLDECNPTGEVDGLQNTIYVNTKPSRIPYNFKMKWRPTLSVELEQDNA